MSRVLEAVLLSLVLAAGACTTAQPDAADLPAEELRGHITVDERGTWFTPCAAADTVEWWVTFTGASVRQIQEARAAGQALRGSRSYVGWLAAVTDERHVGPGGPAVLVREIRELRPAAAADCARADAAAPPGETASVADTVFSERAVVFMEATLEQVQRMLRSHEASDAEVVGDDLMYYRSAAYDFFEAHGVRVTRLEGRRPLAFRVGAQTRTYDFTDAPTLDVLVLYEPGREPVAIAPADLHLAQEYFGWVAATP